MISDLKFNAQGALHFLDRHHIDGVPWAAIEEGSVGAFAGAFLAANAEVRINFDAAKGRMVFVGNPIHAVFDRAIRDARRRARAARATLGDHGQFPGLLLARRVNALRLGFGLDDFAGRYKVMGQIFLPSPHSKFIFPDGRGQVKKLKERGERS